MADTPTLILEAADQLFSEQGYDAVSMRDVAQSAGVNKALVFYHFGSKEDLFAKILEQYYSAHREALAASFVGEGTVLERLHRVIEAYCIFMEKNQRYPRLVQHQMAGAGPHLDLIRENLAPLLEWVREALGELVPTTGPLSARHFFVTFSAATINYFTYAPLLAEQWGTDPLSAEGLAERRAHLHWLVDTLLNRLLEDADPQA